MIARARTVARGPELRKVPLKTLAAATGLCERQVRYILGGKRRPGPEAAEMLLEQLPDPPDALRHGLTTE